MRRITARQRVLAYIRKQRTASSVQISQALKMSAATIRHHLSILAADGRIVMKSEIRIKGRGRPMKVYGLSEKSLGDNLPALADALMIKWPETLPISKQQSAMNSLAVELANQIGWTDPNDIVPGRLSNLLERLNKRHYQAHWEAGSEGPRILFAHCPYAEIIDKHPELCQMDGFLLGEELGGTAQQLAKIDQKPGGITHCIFLIKLWTNKKNQRYG
jgi:predicted ArsR family transcriptional regulator